MIDFPKLTDEFRLNRLSIPQGQLKVVLDTDTYNEIDDQFAVVYALRSAERLKVEAIYAAPFSNDRAETPDEGMEKSFEEILRLLDKLDIESERLVFKGARSYLKCWDEPCRSAAALDLATKAMKSKEPLYVVSIGAITNVASAILMEPRIIEKIVVVWLGGHSMDWQNTDEFNLMQDIHAARLIFNCGVPLIQIPCQNVTSHLTTTIHELDYFLNGKNKIGTYLSDIFRDYQIQHGNLSKEIWDISAVAALINPRWVPANIVHSPILTDQLTWSRDQSRHFIKSAYTVDRDAIFKDLFNKI